MRAIIIVQSGFAWFIYGLFFKGGTVIMEKNTNKNTQKGMNRTEFAQVYSLDTSKKTNKTNKTDKNCNKNSSGSSSYSE